MTGEQIREVVTALPHYEAYTQQTEQANELQEHFPHPTNHNTAWDKDALEANARFVAVRTELMDSKPQFMAEIASAEGSMPLAYRLATLITVDKPLSDQENDVFFMLRDGAPNVNEDLPFKDILRPARNDEHERAAQIGSAFLDIEGKLSGEERVFVAKLAVSAIGEANQTRATFVEGTYVVDPSFGFLNEPIVNSEGMHYEWPDLACQRVSVSGDGLSTPSEGPRDGITPPALLQLMGQFYNKKLVFGAEGEELARELLQAEGC